MTDPISTGGRELVSEIDPRYRTGAERVAERQGGPLPLQVTCTMSSGQRTIAREMLKVE